MCEGVTIMFGRTVVCYTCAAGTHQNLCSCPSDKISVVRNPNYPNVPPALLGFFIQVRDPNADTPLGEFVNFANYAKIGDCGSRNTLTHSDNAPKPVDQGLEFFWNPANVPATTKNVQVL